MSRIILQPSANPDAKRHYEETVLVPVPLETINKHLDASTIERFSELREFGAIGVWGVVPGVNGINVGKWERVGAGDVALFTGDGRIFASARVVGPKIRNAELAVDLWGRDEDGETWEYIYFLTDVRPLDIPYEEFNRAVGYRPNYNVLGFNVLDETRSLAGIEHFGFDGGPVQSELETSPVAGKYYSKENIENIFDTNFGARIKGITLRRTEEDEPYILLFSTAQGRELYGDEDADGAFYYTGEGQEGDQEMTVANKALADSITDQRAIHGFRQNEAGGEYQYLGQLEVESYAYIEEDGRKVYKYKLKRDLLDEKGEEVLDIEDEVEPDETKLLAEAGAYEDVGPSHTISSSPRKVRRENRKQKARVAKLEDHACQVCGWKLEYEKDGEKRHYIHVDHIYDKEKGGGEDLNNLWALCPNHHAEKTYGVIRVDQELKKVFRKGEEIELHHNKHLWK